MADDFSPDDLSIIQNSLGTLAQRAQGQAARTIQANQDMLDTLQSENQRVNSSVRAASVQLEDNFRQQQEVMDNVENINSLPSGIAQLIGYFDEDYSADVQQTRLLRLQMSNEHISNRLALTKQQAELARGMSAARLEALKSETALTIQQFGMAIQQLDANAKLKAQERQEVQDAISNLSLNQLEAYANGREPLPQILAGKEGLIESEYLVRQNASLQVAAQELSVGAAQRNLALLEIDDSNLAKMANGQAEIPAGLSQAMVQNEYDRRTRSALSLQELALAVKAGRSDLAEAISTRHLNDQNSTVLRSYLAQAEQQGGNLTLNIDGTPITFTGRQIKEAISLANQSEMQYEAEGLSRQVAIETSQIQTQSIIESAQTFAGINGGAMPPSVRQAMETVQVTSATLAGVLESDAQGPKKDAAIALLQQQIQTSQAAITAAQEAFLENRPKEEQAAYRAYFDNNGSFTQYSDAATVLISEGLDSEPHISLPFLRSTVEQFSSAIMDQRRYDTENIVTLGAPQSSINASGQQSLSLGSRTARDAEQIVREVVEMGTGKTNDEGRPLTYQNQAAAQIVNYVMGQTIAQLAKADSPTASLFKGLVSDDGYFASQFMRMDEKGNSKFARPAFMQELARREVLAKAQGIMPADQSIVDILQERYRLASGEFAKNYKPGSPVEAAIGRVLFNNNYYDPLIRGGGQFFKVPFNISGRQFSSISELIEMNKQVLTQNIDTAKATNNSSTLMRMLTVPPNSLGARLGVTMEEATNQRPTPLIPGTEGVYDE